MVEGAATAEMYNNKSIAENDSIDVGKIPRAVAHSPTIRSASCSSFSLPDSCQLLTLKVFMLPNFETLCDFMFSSPAELERFQDLVQQIVQATDIVDPDLKSDRKKRWRPSVRLMPLPRNPQVRRFA